MHLVLGSKYSVQYSTHTQGIANSSSISVNSCAKKGDNENIEWKIVIEVLQ